MAIRGFFRLIPALGLLLVLSACAGSGAPGDQASGPLLPMPESAVHDPDDTALVHAMQDYVRTIHAPLNSQYEYTRVDLDGDGRRDALVHLTNPYRTWCDIYGCTLIVLKADDDNFHYVSQLRPIRPPLVVSDAETNGWRDLIVHVDGRWTRTKDVAMQFNGRAYPVDPDRQPALPRYADLGGQKIFP